MQHTGFTLKWPFFYCHASRYYDWNHIFDEIMSRIKQWIIDPDMMNIICETKWTREFSLWITYELRFWLQYAWLSIRELETRRTKTDRQTKYRTEKINWAKYEWKYGIRSGSIEFTRTARKNTKKKKETKDTSRYTRWKLGTLSQSLLVGDEPLCFARIKANTHKLDWHLTYINTNFLN